MRSGDIYLFSCPEYTITNFGIFDTEVIMPHAVYSDWRDINAYEIELITSCDKDATTFLGKNEFRLMPNVFICAKPGMRRRSRLHFKCLYVHIKVIDSEMQEFLDSLPDFCLLSENHGINEIFEKLLCLDKENGNIENRLLLQSHISKLLANLSKIASFKDINSSSSLFFHRDELLKIEKYIRTYPEEKLDLNTLSEKINLSPVYFHKIFTQYFGKTPAKYVLHCRIERAKLLLLTQNDSVLDIAFKCGFSSQSYFNVKFREEVGISPLQYRKKMLSQVQI